MLDNCKFLINEIQGQLLAAVLEPNPNIKQGIKIKIVTDLQTRKITSEEKSITMRLQSEDNKIEMTEIEIGAKESVLDAVNPQDTTKKLYTNETARTNAVKVLLAEDKKYQKLTQLQEVNKGVIVEEERLQSIINTLLTLALTIK